MNITEEDHDKIRITEESELSKVITPKLISVKVNQDLTNHPESLHRDKSPD